MNEQRPHDHHCADCDMAEFAGMTYESAHPPKRPRYEPATVLKQAMDWCRAQKITPSWWFAAELALKDAAPSPVPSTELERLLRQWQEAVKASAFYPKAQEDRYRLERRLLAWGKADPSSPEGTVEDP